ncbi:MAG TPA: phosphotransferase [Thermomicrobiales bacterium]|nr:phosphotransferase [Thermomicrobiales bacterium]
MTESTIDNELRQAAAAFFPQATAVTAVSDHDDVVRVETGQGDFRVRRWPLNIAPERIRFVHDLLTIATAPATGAGLDFIPALHPLPDGALLLHLGRHNYDATTWIPGRTPERHTPPVGPDGESVLLPAPLSTVAHASLTRRSAELHEATAPLAARPDAPRVTVQSVFQAVQTAWQAHRTRLRPISPEHPIIQRWLRTGERAIPAAERAFAQYQPAEPGRQVACHLNLWPAHVILGRREGQEQVVGLIDFTEAAIAIRLLDLAQVATRFSPWTDEIAELVTGAYNEISTLTPEERRLLPAMAALDLVAETGRLLTLAYAPIRRPEQDRSLTLRDGGETLTRSLENATAALYRSERPSKAPRRQWVRRGPGRSQPRQGGTPRGRRDNRS